MLKFDIIETKQKIDENQFSEKVKKRMGWVGDKNIFQRDHNNSAFIIAKRKEGNVIGGACLFKKGLKNIQEDLSDLVTTLPLQGHVWECPDIYLEPSYSSKKKESDNFSQIFYRGLYETFVEFGKIKKVGFLIIKLDAKIYVSTKEFGLWPYVVELKPKNSPDGLFYGILPLSGSQYQSYQKLWGKPFHHFTNFPDIQVQAEIDGIYF